MAEQSSTRRSLYIARSAGHPDTPMIVRAHVCVRVCVALVCMRVCVCVCACVRVCVCVCAVPAWYHCVRAQPFERCLLRPTACCW